MLKTKISISLLLARSLSLIARINALQLLARIKDIWSDKEQRSLRKKLFVSRLLQTRLELTVPPVLLVAAGDAMEQRRSSLQRRMSAFGTKRTSRDAQSMSAFGGKADIARRCPIVPCGLLGAIHTSHELMVKTSNRGDNHDAMSVQDTTASGGISGR